MVAASEVFAEFETNGDPVMYYFISMHNQLLQQNPHLSLSLSECNALTSTMSILWQVMQIKTMFD